MRQACTWDHCSAVMCFVPFHPGNAFPRSSLTVYWVIQLACILMAAAHFSRFKHAFSVPPLAAHTCAKTLLEPIMKTVHRPVESGRDQMERGMRESALR